MCVVSMVSDNFGHEWTKQRINDPYNIEWLQKIQLDPTQITLSQSPFTVEQYYALKQQVKDLTALLRLALEYDKRTDQPDCESEDKLARIRPVAAAFGVDIDAILSA